MNNRQKEILQQQLKNEKAVVNKLKKEYDDALKEIEDKIKIFQIDIKAKQTGLKFIHDEKQKALLQSEIQAKIYQKEYQTALKQQLGVILDSMNSKQYDTIKDYIESCYEDGFIGTMYDLQGQGIPLILPINQAEAIDAILNDTKLSKPLYESLGYDVQQLKKIVNSEVTRGIAVNLSYADIARNITRKANVTMNKSMRIARTEGHRVANQAAYNAQMTAIDNGADVVKQWDATLDSRTRNLHAELDGQIREIKEPFEVGGYEAQYPGEFGIAALDVNCRCALLQRAKWALDSGELETLKQRAEYYGLDKTKDFDDFKKKYINAD